VDEGVKKKWKIEEINLRRGSVVEAVADAACSSTGGEMKKLTLSAISCQSAI